MGLYPGIGSNLDAFLYFHERPNKTIFSNRALINIDWFNNGDTFAKMDIPYTTFFYNWFVFQCYNPLISRSIILKP